MPASSSRRPTPGSGDQSRAVEAGLPADVVALSLWPDIDRLVAPGIVAPDWWQNEHDGIVTDSIVVFAVRPGNPKGIGGWDDLIRDDVDVITPNPFTSGGAQWNLLAAYQAQIVAGRSDEEATAYLKALIANTSVMDRSARESLTTFAAGQGDVLIAYENEAIFAQQAGQTARYVVPDATILIENPVAVTLTGDAPDAAAAFVDFLYTPEAQAVFGGKGYRPVLPRGAGRVRLRQPANLFTIADLGGWAEARPRFFDPETGIVARIFAELGRASARESASAAGAPAASRLPASARFDGRGLMGPGITAVLPRPARAHPHRRHPVALGRRMASTTSWPR